MSAERDLAPGGIAPLHAAGDGEGARPSLADSTPGEETASWAPVNLAFYLDGEHEPVVPTLLTRSDGVSLIYPGMTHSFHGESESGKSLLLQAECAGLIATGQNVLYLDFESDPESVLERLLTLGASKEAILKHFTYLRPEVAPSTATEARAWARILAGDYVLAVVDGVTDALSVFKLATNDNDDITSWMRLVPKKIGTRTGAAVALIDHVTKEGDGRGRFAIGAQAKMAALTGAAYTVTVVEPIGRGLRGVIELRVVKDRPGQVRGFCGPMRKDQSQEAARVLVDATGESTRVAIEPPATGSSPNASEPSRSVAVMEQVSRALEEAGEPVSFNKLSGLVSRKQQAVKSAVEALVLEGFVDRRDGPNRSQLHSSLKPFRAAADALPSGGLGAGEVRAEFRFGTHLGAERGWSGSHP